MDDEKTIELGAKLVGIEFLLGKLLHHSWRDVPESVFEALDENYRRELSLMPSPGLDPVMADHKASITSDEVARVMDFVRTLRRLNPPGSN